MIYLFYCKLPHPHLFRYFADLKDAVEGFGPHQIYNVDEQGLSHTHSPTKVVHSRLANCTEVSPGKGSLTTLLAACNAVGNTVPPFWIFAGERFQNSFIKDSVVPGSAGTVTSNGWSNGDVFLNYLKKTFC